MNHLMTYSQLNLTREELIKGDTGGTYVVETTPFPGAKLVTCECTSPLSFYRRKTIKSKLIAELEVPIGSKIVRPFVCDCNIWCRGHFADSHTTPYDRLRADKIIVRKIYNPDSRSKHIGLFDSCKCYFNDQYSFEYTKNVVIESDSFSNDPYIYLPWGFDKGGIYFSQIDEIYEE